MKMSSWQESKNPVNSTLLHTEAAGGSLKNRTLCDATTLMKVDDKHKTNIDTGI